MITLRRSVPGIVNVGLPLGAMLLAFTGLTNTTFKIVFMAGVLLVQFRRTMRMIDGTLLALVFFLGVHGLVHSQSADAGFIIYQAMTFPVLAYLLGKSFASRAPSAEWISSGVLLMGVALALFPVGVVLRDVASAGFTVGSRNLYVEEFGLAMSATVMGGLLTLGISQSAGLIVGGFRRQKRLFAIGLVLAAILLTVALRLGNRTQVMILVVCLAFGSVYSTSGPHAMWKKLGVGVVAVGLIAMVDQLVPALLYSDIGTHFRDRASDPRLGLSTMGARTERWVYGLVNLAAHPMGWRLSDGGYAHNMWLDVARVSGWAGLFALVVFTAVHLRAVQRTFRGLERGQLKTSLMLGLVAANLLFLIEPIMDGYLYVFYAYCSVVGMAIGTRTSLAHSAHTREMMRGAHSPVRMVPAQRAQ